MIMNSNWRHYGKDGKAFCNQETYGQNEPT